MIKLQTSKESDEIYTPIYAVYPILQYIKPNSTIWCPFDKEWSAYVEVLREEGHIVIYSHIEDGKDFLTYEPEEDYDYIISNAPFSIKDKVLKRLIELNKPFAVLLPIATLQGQKRFEYISQTQALIFDKRIGFYTWQDLSQTKESAAFGTYYCCKDFLPQNLIFERLEKFDRNLKGV